MELAIRAIEPVNLEKATDLVTTEMFVKAGITARGIAAKCRSMTPPVEYVKAERTSKTGEPIAKKDEIVAKIAEAIGVTSLKSLAKAEKADLQVLFAAVSEFTSPEPKFAGE